MPQTVHDMFADIAPRYDLTNDVLSFGIHRLWRTKALRQIKLRKDAFVVDVCCGTGDVSFAAARHVPESGRVLGVDFVYPMLEGARQRARKRGASAVSVDFVHADARALPLEDDCADLVSVSFGIRNVQPPIAGLREMKRVARPGAEILVIEFGQPRFPVFSFLYRQYSKYLMPLIGALLTGNKEAYQYLPHTAEQFPAAEKFTALMQEAGIQNPRFTPLLSGLAYIYRGQA